MFDQQSKHVLPSLAFVLNGGNAHGVSEALEALNDMARSAILQQNCWNQLTVGTNKKSHCVNPCNVLKFGLSALESDETFVNIEKYS